MKFLFLDEVYSDAWAAGPHTTLNEWFYWSFGTSNFWDIALRAAGHESETHVLNFDPHWQLKVAQYKPDVIISQNVGVWGAYEGSPLNEFRRLYGVKLVGMCSYRAVDQTLTGWDALFSSFNWMPDYCASLGQKCHYLPLAFGRPVLDRIGELPKERDIPVVFIGGLGSRIWDQGTKTMAEIACKISEFKWWGYKVGVLPFSLEESFQGAAWGLDYYRILARTKVCVNRHGEIAARGGSLFGNNLRQYEASAMGCILYTDHLGEIGPEKNAFYYPLGRGEGLQVIFEEMSERPDDFKTFSKWGVENILKNHTYESRVPRFLEVVENL